VSSTGKVQVVVRTRRVPVGTAVVTAPLYTPSGVLVGSTASRVVLYDTRMDETYRAAISEGRRLSRRLGLDLEVVDVSKLSLFRRLLSLVRWGTSDQPAFLVAPPAEESHGSAGLVPV
jgi:hypothetical protein